MGGASSYLALLSICGFLTAAWTASKVSRLLGVSSIVLEIATGVILGPGALNLIVEEYASCSHARQTSCLAPVNALELALADRSLRDLSPFRDVCHAHQWAHRESSGHGRHYRPEDHPGGYLDYNPNATKGQDRRLSGAGGDFASFADCLERSCQAEVAHRCGLTPDVFTLVGHIGVALMIFESGMHFDFEKAKVVGLPACCVAVVGTVLPLVVGSLLMVAFGKPLRPQGISAGTALAPTSVGIALRLLGEAGVLQQDFGQAIITAAFVDDILSLVLFNVLFSLGGDFDAFKTVVAPLIGIAFMLLAMVAAVKVWPKVITDIVLPQLPESRDGAAEGWRKMRLEKDEVLFLMQITLLVVYSFVTHLLGTHLWGCFIAGMSFACLQPAGHAHHVWVHQTKRMTTWMIRIFFSCTVAFSIPVGRLMSLGAFWRGSILGVFACILTKVCCAPFMGRARWVIGWAMVGRAEFAYLIAQMALSANMLDAESFSIVIWALLYATIFAPFIFRYLLNRFVEAEGLEGWPQASADGSPHALREDPPLEAPPPGEAMREGGCCAAEPEESGGLEPKLRSFPRHKKPPTPRRSDSFVCCLFFKRLLV